MWIYLFSMSISLQLLDSFHPPSNHCLVCMSCKYWPLNLLKHQDSKNVYARKTLFIQTLALGIFINVIYIVWVFPMMINQRLFRAIWQDGQGSCLKIYRQWGVAMFVHLYNKEMGLKIYTKQAKSLLWIICQNPEDMER